MEVYCDGKTVVTYMPVSNLYTTYEFSPGLVQDTIDKIVQFAGPREEMTDAAGEMDYVALYKRLVPEAHVAGGEKVGTFDCWRVEGKFGVPGPEGEKVLVPVKIWHRKADGFPVKIHQDITPVMKQAAAEASEDIRPQIPQSLTATVTLTTLKLNEPIPEETFVFTPPEGARKMELFDDASPGEEGLPSLEEFELSGQAAPEFSGRLLDGTEIKLSDLKGKVVVLNFWASWCGPCREELPLLQKLWERVQDRDVAILGINVLETPGEARGMIESTGMTFPSVLDAEGEIAQDYGASSIPYMVLIDRQGIVVGRLVGYDPQGTALLEKQIEALLPAPAVN
jgi:peroxiredoxin